MGNSGCWQSSTLGCHFFQRSGFGLGPMLPMASSSVPRKPRTTVFFIWGIMGGEMLPFEMTLYGRIARLDAFRALAYYNPENQRDIAP
jgi:ferredoxin-NADP reductase